MSEWLREVDQHPTSRVQDSLDQDGSLLPDRRCIAGPLRDRRDYPYRSTKHSRFAVNTFVTRPGNTSPTCNASVITLHSRSSSQCV